ncbi:phBC6A51 family helix-turn-helix protein [Sutcliffiella sp. NC1]|uniref:phBC6A51 family helix-turn-helix protein n=1 Tax=Sutcliffiella sp. NC1 TaxID=3004096 RepID=UPI0022DE083D|nr:phBC6A51 family helix-turn-helix protein [Sutcliffiella sp. NC1]WBL16359.1 phBC6A51 family helix-turn-helix protein [Sutcliffiella sp. NC1]
MYEKLDDRKRLAIELLAEGIEKKTDIAKKCGVVRQTIYDWLELPEFKAALDARLTSRKVFVEKFIDSKLESAVDELIHLAETTENARVKAQVLQYIIDRGLGKPVSKHQIETSLNDSNNVNEDVLDAEFEEWEQDE